MKINLQYALALGGMVAALFKWDQLSPGGRVAATYGRHRSPGADAHSAAGGSR